jgi:hypothetical protein
MNVIGQLKNTIIETTASLAAAEQAFNTLSTYIND